MNVGQYIFQNQKVFSLIQKFLLFLTHMRMLFYIHENNLYIWLD